MIDDRRNRILRGIDIEKARGLEIGPLAWPIVRKAEGDITYVDHTDTEGLRRQYADNPHIPVDKIVEVDAAWGGQTLAKAVDGKRFDYIVASHVVEHVPDLIGWFQELTDVLAPGGEIRLVVPDKQYTFDHLRRETTFADVLAAHAIGARVPQPQQIIDFEANYAPVDVRDAWAGRRPESIPPATHESVQRWLSRAHEALDGAYHNVHCWVFTPRSWGDLCADLVRVGMLEYECSMFWNTLPDTYEFGVGLRRNASREVAARTWERMASDANMASTRGSGADLEVVSRIEALDAGLFAIQPGIWPDRVSFLRLQRLIRRRVGPYVYLEVGSDLGASLLPHLLDPLCRAAISIDPRPLSQPDERGTTFHYEGNSTERMRGELAAVTSTGSLAKLITIEADASDVTLAQLPSRANLVLIDAEHTNVAAFSDFVAVLPMLAQDAIISFHDADLTADAIRNAERMLRYLGVPHALIFLPDRVAAIGLGLMDQAVREELAPHALDREAFLTASRLMVQEAVAAAVAARQESHNDDSAAPTTAKEAQETSAIEPTSTRTPTDLEAELKAARLENALLRSSTSWRMTAPLRRIVMSVRRRT